MCPNRSQTEDDGRDNEQGGGGEGGGRDGARDASDASQAPGMFFFFSSFTNYLHIDYSTQEQRKRAQETRRRRVSCPTPLFLPSSLYHHPPSLTLYSWRTRQIHEQRTGAHKRGTNDERSLSFVPWLPCQKRPKQRKTSFWSYVSVFFLFFHIYSILTNIHSFYLHFKGKRRVRTMKKAQRYVFFFLNHVFYILTNDLCYI